MIKKFKFGIGENLQVVSNGEIGICTGRSQLKIESIFFCEIESDGSSALVGESKNVSYENSYLIGANWHNEDDLQERAIAVGPDCMHRGEIR